MSNDFPAASYDEWKTRGYDDDISPLDEARAEIDSLHKEIDRLAALLERCAEFFETAELAPDLTAKINAALETI